MKETKEDELREWLEFTTSVTPLKPINKILPGRASQKIILRREALLPPTLEPQHYGKLENRQRHFKKVQEVDTTIDLHGMTLNQAERRLYQFLSYQQYVGNKTVLVITGKGIQSEGKLRQNLPNWLNTWTKLIASFGYAKERHGGQGAFYVNLKKINK